MQPSIQAVLQIFKNLNFEAYYNGEKCRNELYNELIKGKHLKTLNTTIITNALPDDIKRIFPNAIQNPDNEMSFMIEFGNEKMCVESFHSQTYYVNENGKEHFLSVPIVKSVSTLDEDFVRKVFTINCVAKDIEGNNYYGVSARMDMGNKTIKTIEDSKKTFYEYPIRCLQAFVLMSQTGFSIEKQTLKDIKSTMRYLRYMPSELVGKELRKIIVGNNVIPTLKLMQKIGIFNSKCLVEVEVDENKTERQKEKIMTPFHIGNASQFDVLSKFRISSEIELELWSLLFEDVAIAKTELGKFNCFTDKELNTILWLMNNRNICKVKGDIEIRQAIYNSISDYEKTEGIHYLKELILMSSHIYKMTDEIDTKEQKKENCKRLMFNLCCRPYFVNQLTWDVTDKQKEVLITKLLEEKVYPISDEEISNYIAENGGI